MIDTIKNPRSVLHALQPMRLGTGDVESLLSYFCRLAVSHSTSTLSLSRTVAQRFQHDVDRNFDWHERQLSGIRESALTWSSALSAMTSVPRLDRLTFLPWRNVISQNGLSMVSKGQFCPQCLAEDQVAGRSPYYRLAWESKAVSVCHIHGARLTRHCPSCGRDNIRHAAAFVVPGWCTKCGEFLGCRTPSPSSTDGVEPLERWKAEQLAKLLEAQQRLDVAPSRQELLHAIQHIMDEMDGGRSSHFARRVGLSKSTVHHWLQSEGSPTLEMSMQVASQSGMDMTELLCGDTSSWKAPSEGQQLTLKLLLPPAKRRGSPREIDWADVELQLQRFLQHPTPISVLEAARRLDVEARQLYLHANQTTRQVGKRWEAYRKRRGQANLDQTMPILEAVGRELVLEGRSVTRREVVTRVPTEVLALVPRLFDVLRDVQRRIESEMRGHT